MNARLALTASALLASAALVSATATTAAAAKPAPAPGSVVPDKDPFYRAPRGLGQLAPGTVVASRPVPVTFAGVPLSVQAWQISYRTDDSRNKPELAVTTLVVPNAAWTGTGARPVVSAQTPEDSVGTQCAPSYLLASGADEQDVALDTGFLQQGWAVELPDFEGPQSEFFAGAQAGHAVLDGIRAVKGAGLGSIGATNPVALNGYSGGAEATGWAAQLQPSYAPDVSLVGAAIGGTPSDPAAVAAYIDGGPFAGFEFAAAYGIATAFPQAHIQRLLNAAGMADFTKIKGECETTILSQFAGKKLADDTTVPQPLAVPSVAKVLVADTLGAAAPTTPVYDYHANTDEIVPVTQDNTMVAAWCAAGATVSEHRDLVGEHAAEVVAQMGAVTTFLTARFAGTPPTSTC